MFNDAHKFQIFPFQTLGIYLANCYFPACWWLNAQVCSSGSLCRLQKIYPHLHSTPSRPSFFLHSKHLFLSICCYLTGQGSGISLLECTVLASGAQTETQALLAFCQISSFQRVLFFLYKWPNYLQQEEQRPAKTSEPQNSTHSLHSCLAGYSHQVFLMFMRQNYKQVSTSSQHLVITTNIIGQSRLRKMLNLAMNSHLSYFVTVMEILGFLQEICQLISQSGSSFMLLNPYTNFQNQKIHINGSVSHAGSQSSICQPVKFHQAVQPHLAHNCLGGQTRVLSSDQMQGDQTYNSMINEWRTKEKASIVRVCALGNQNIIDQGFTMLATNNALHVERLEYKLAELSGFSDQEALLIFKKMIEGHYAIFRKMGGTSIGLQKCWLNKDGEVRVWVNQSLHQNNITGQILKSEHQIITRSLELMESLVGTQIKQFKQYVVNNTNYSATHAKTHNNITCNINQNRRNRAMSINISSKEQIRSKTGNRSNKLTLELTKKLLSSYIQCLRLKIPARVAMEKLKKCSMNLDLLSSVHNRLLLPDQYISPTLIGQDSQNNVRCNANKSALSVSQFDGQQTSLQDSLNPVLLREKTNYVKAFNSPQCGSQTQDDTLECHKRRKGSYAVPIQKNKENRRKRYSIFDNSSSQTTQTCQRVIDNPDKQTLIPQTIICKKEHSLSNNHNLAFNSLPEVQIEEEESARQTLHQKHSHNFVKPYTSKVTPTPDKVKASIISTTNQTQVMRNPNHGLFAKRITKFSTATMSQQACDAKQSRYLCKSDKKNPCFLHKHLQGDSLILSLHDRLKINKNWPTHRSNSFVSYPRNKENYLHSCSNCRQEAEKSMSKNFAGSKTHDQEFLDVPLIKSQESAKANGLPMISEKGYKHPAVSRSRHTWQQQFKILSERVQEELESFEATENNSSSAFSPVKNNNDSQAQADTKPTSKQANQFLLGNQSTNSKKKQQNNASNQLLTSMMKAQVRQQEVLKGNCWNKKLEGLIHMCSRQSQLKKSINEGPDERIMFSREIYLPHLMKLGRQIGESVIPGDHRNN